MNGFVFDYFHSMKSFLRIFAFLSLTFGAQAQVVFNKTSYDFDELYAFSDRFVDITLTNRTGKKAFVLSVKKPKEVAYLFTGQEMQADSSVTLRFQVNPVDKGKFSYNIEVFTSDRMEPVKLKLKGEMLEVLDRQTSSLQACPNFGQRAPGADPTAFDMTVVLIDKETNKPLSKGYVSMLQNGREIGTFKTGKDGRMEETVPLGWTYFFAQRDGYKPVEHGGYINFNRNLLVLEMEPLPVEEEVLEEVAEVEPEEPEEEIEEEEVPLPDEEGKESVFKEKLEEASNQVPVPPALSELDRNDFSSEYFKPINVVFVLDVSSSMRNSSKMELMKFSLYELVEMLRAEDRVGIVKYGSKADVLIAGAAGTDKKNINKQVADLKAAGMTAGGAGIKMGFREARKTWLPEGVNQVIVITDGAFNKDSKDYKRAVRRYRRYGIKMSVVGIKPKEPDAVKMQETSDVGQGIFIRIDDLVGAKENLKQGLRGLSYRGL